MAKIAATLVARDATQEKPQTSFMFDVKISRWYIWTLKIRLAWSVITAKVNDNDKQRT